MPLVQYGQVTDIEMRSKVRTGYKSEIDQLVRLGFREFCAYSETTIPCPHCIIPGGRSRGQDTQDPVRLPTVRAIRPETPRPLPTMRGLEQHGR
jgi:hypothetical protein